MKTSVLALIAAVSCVADSAPSASAPKHYAVKRRAPTEAPTAVRRQFDEAVDPLFGSFRTSPAVLTGGGVEWLQRLGNERPRKAARHDATPRRSGRRFSRSISHLPHVSVTVRYPQSPVNILVPLGHEMTTYGALSEAEVLYAYRHPTRDNAFTHRLEKLEHVPCWGIASFGGVNGGEDGYRWHVRVTDQRAGEVLHDSFCLPRGSALKMRSHFLIEFYRPSSS